MRYENFFPIKFPRLSRKLDTLIQKSESMFCLPLYLFFIQKRDKRGFCTNVLRKILRQPRWRSGSCCSSKGSIPNSPYIWEISPKKKPMKKANIFFLLSWFCVSLAKNYCFQLIRMKPLLYCMCLKVYLIKSQEVIIFNNPVNIH